MDNYVTGATIKRLRESKGMTQEKLGEMIGVGSKAVSKWETARGLPDIALIEPLAKALSVSVMELMSGNAVTNNNKACNMLKSKFYVCPVCGNAIHSTGETVVSCCGITLPPLEAEETDESHQIIVETVEDEKFVTIHHDMTKEHYISFMACVTADKLDFKKLYPEGNAETRFNPRGHGYIYFYCNKHGLMRIKI